MTPAGKRVGSQVSMQVSGRFARLGGRIGYHAQSLPPV